MGTFCIGRGSGRTGYSRGTAAGGGFSQSPTHMCFGGSVIITPKKLLTISLPVQPQKEEHNVISSSQLIPKDISKAIKTLSS